MDEDMEDYGFEYSDEDTEEENVDIENQYYHAKESLEGNEYEEALEGFAAVSTCRRRSRSGASKP